MKKIIFGFFILFALSIQAQTNLIKNGGFESGTDNWRGDSGTTTSYYKQSGKNALTINQYVGNEWKGIDQITSLPKNSYAIQFSVWIKTDAIEGGKEIYNAAVMTIEFLEASEKNIKYESIAQIQGTTEWTLITKAFVLPENAKKFRTMLALAQTNGTVFFDEIKAVVLTKEEYQIIEKK